MIADVDARGAGLGPAAHLFERHHREVYAYLCRLVRDRAWAEDLVQETFLHALAARRGLAEVQNPRAWLYRIATNLALKGLKRRRRFAWLPWGAADRYHANAPDNASEVAGRGAVEEALAALPPDYRAPLLLYAHYGLSVAEVAEALNLSQGAVKMRLCRGREMFREAYERGNGR